MIADKEARQRQTYGHQDTEDDVGGLPIPHKNHPGDRWRENKRSNAIARHHNAHDEAATFLKPPCDQGRRGQKKGTPPRGSNDPIPEIKRLDGCGRAGHVDPEAMYQGTQEEDHTYTMGVEK
jgi:hypothetical protein